jgi:hypothetical protein
VTAAAACAVAAVAAFCTAANAADLAPTPAAIAKAAGAGAALAPRHEGYPLKDHVLYEVRDARGADPADGAVDAIVLATPLERTRHAAYIAAYSGRMIAPARAFAEGGLAPGQIAILVFAHSADEDDARFVREFSPATLEMAGGVRLVAQPFAGATMDSVYPRAAAGRRERQVATIIYRFDLSAARDAGRQSMRLTLKDSTGRPFDLTFDLARFE